MRKFDRAAALTRYGRDAVDCGLEILLVDHQALVVVDRDHPCIVREGAVDQLGGEHHIADCEADFAGRQFDRDFSFAGLDQALDLAHSLARHDDARHASSALRQRQFDLRKAVPVGRHRPQRSGLGRACGMQIDAVEVIARFLGGDRKLGLVDQPF